MKNADWLTRFLFIHARTTRPDGRPLYAYKCSDKKYAELKELAKEKIELALRGRKADQVAAIFCFYAASTFCREHKDGVWAWETVFRPLGIKEPEYQYIKDWVEQGLKWWQRPLIEQKDRRLFLSTIACEGGLPLQLLQKDNAAINHFFRAVLESYHAQGCGGIEMAETLSRHQAYRLPTSLRQDVVFHLSGELIAAVVNLQREIGGENNPIEALDEKVSDWRLRLPLRLEAQTAETLFKGLVKRSSELVSATKSRLRWRGRLQQTVASWRVVKHLELPETITGGQIRQWLGHKNGLPSRLRLLVNTPSGKEVIAWLTLNGGIEETSRYRSEWLRRGGLSLIDNAVLESHALSLHDGQNEYPLNVENGEPWGEAPWLFIEKNTAGELEFLGEGSVRTSAIQAKALVSDNFVVKVNETGSCETIGNYSTLKRTLYQVGGTVDFLTLDQDCYRTVCQATTDSTESYSIVGNPLNKAINQNPVYLGLPRITNSSGNFSPTYRTQWRPVNNGGKWREGEQDCVGLLWLRLQDSTTGIEIFRRQISVLPKTFRINTVIGEGLTPGQYHLSGLMGALVNIDAGEHVAQLSDSFDGINIVCPLLHTTNLPELAVNLCWSTGSIVVRLSYPQCGAIFQLAGQILRIDDCISLDRIGGLRLLLQDHVAEHRYWLDAELISSSPIDSVLPRLRFRDRLPALVNGRCETTLLVWQERIASLLNSSRSLDAYILIEVTSTQGKCLAHLKIARFDSFIEPNFSAYRVGVSNDVLSRLGNEWRQRIRLEMFPLWSPSSLPRSLILNSEHEACWNVPNDLQQGPWWIIARDGDWARFRPLLWLVTNIDTTLAGEENISALVLAIQEPNAEQREIMFSELLQELGQNPDHLDWVRLFDLIRLSREFPTSSIDVLTRLVNFRQTLALALLKADDELFDCVWALAEQMPFSWGLLSAHCWMQASTLHFQSLSKALGEIDTDGDIVFSIFQQFRERTCARREYWSALCDWLQESIFRDRPLQNSPLKIARQLPAFFEEQITQAEQELQSRHDAEERWPQSDEVMQRGMHGLVDEQHQYQRLDLRYRAVRCAPYVVANLSCEDLAKSVHSGIETRQTESVHMPPIQLYEITDNLIYELRLLRAFDPEWFDAVYAYALTLELSRLPLEVAP